MYKKEIFRDLDKKYNSHLYIGLFGLLMNYCHRKLEHFKNNNVNYNKILEIGAGSAPHFSYMDCSYNECHIAETSDYVEYFLSDFLLLKKLIKFLEKNLIT